jgi:hypothetical protein
MGSPTHYAYCGKEMFGCICEKMATPESALKGGKFSASSSTTAGNSASTCNNLIHRKRLTLFLGHTILNVFI